MKNKSLLFATIVALLVSTAALRASGKDDVPVTTDPTSTTVDDKGSGGHGADDPATKVDDKGTDPTEHVAGDDKGGAGGGTDDPTTKTDDKGTDPTEHVAGDDKNGTQSDDPVKDKLAEVETRRGKQVSDRKALVDKLDHCSEEERKQVIEQLKADAKAHEQEQRDLAKQVRDDLKKDRRTRGGGV